MNKYSGGSLYKVILAVSAICIAKLTQPKYRGKPIEGGSSKATKKPIEGGSSKATKKPIEGGSKAVEKKNKYKRPPFIFH